MREMFSAIAPRYDRTNTVISAGLHLPWKRQTVAALDLRPGQRALDLCCGTGDLAHMMMRAVGSRSLVVGLDFAAPMIVEATRRTSAGGATAASRDGVFRTARPVFLVGDAMKLPFTAESFDAVAVAFGLRNVADPAGALQEIRRVLRPGGVLAILEFARVPNPALRALYDVYSYTLMAVLGRVVSGHPDAYWYLPVSVRHWLDQAAMVQLLRETGFVHPTYWNLAQGVVAIYRAEAGARDA